MTLADEMPPTLCMKSVASVIETNLNIILRNIPEDFEPVSIRLEKFCLLERSLLAIKEYTKEGLKARLRGSSDAVADLDIGSFQQTLPGSEEGETRCTVTGPDGIERETSVAQMEAVTEGIERKDPKIMKKLRALEAEEHA